MLSSSLLSMIIINQPGYLISNTAKTFLKMAATYYQQQTDYIFAAFVYVSLMSHFIGMPSLHLIIELYQQCMHIKDQNNVPCDLYFFKKK